MEPEFIQTEGEAIHDNNHYMTPLSLNPQNNQNPNNMSPLIISDKIGDYDGILQNQSKDSIYKNLDHYLYMGKTNISSNNFVQAIKIYELITDICPQNPNAWVLLGRVAFQLNQYNKAANAYQTAIQKCQKAQNDIRVWYDMAISFFRIENYQQSENAFLQVLKMDSNFPCKTNIYLFLALIKKLNFNYKAALDYFIKSLNEENSLTLLQITQILLNIGVCLEQLKEKALQINENPNEALKCMGWHFFLQRSYKQTLDLFGKIEEQVRNNDFDILFMTAKCLEAQQQYTSAMQQFNKAMRINPNNSGKAWCCLGLSFYKFNMQKDAFNCFLKAHYLEPSLLDSLFNMALMYESAKNYMEASNIYNKLLQCNPDDATAIRRKNAIESGNVEQLIELPLREPEFRIKINLWIDNQIIPMDKQQPNQSPIFNNQKRMMPQMKNKKNSEEFSILMQPCAGEYIELGDQQTFRGFANPLIYPYQNIGSITQQSPMPFNFPPLEPELSRCPSPLPSAINLEKKDECIDFEPQYLDGSPKIRPKSPNNNNPDSPQHNMYGQKQHRKSSIGLRKTSINGFFNNNINRKKSSVDWTSNYDLSKGTIKNIQKSNNDYQQ